VAAAEAVCGERAFLDQCPAIRRTLANVSIAGRSYARVFGGTIPAPMWKTYMERAVEAYEPLDFRSPPPHQTSPVPDLRAAFDVSDAKLRAEAAGFTFRIAELRDGSPAGTIVSQSPEPGAPLELGRTIVVFVSGGPDAPLVLPDVIGLTQDDAARRLQALGYVVELVGVITDDPSRHLRVVAMRPVPGTVIAPSPENVIVLEILLHPPSSG